MSKSEANRIRKFWIHYENIERKFKFYRLARKIVQLSTETMQNKIWLNSNPYERSIF